MWIDPKTGAVARLHSDIRALRPNWSGPAVITDAMVSDLGFVPVTAPAYDPQTQKLVEHAPVKSGATYTMIIDAVTLTDAEKAAIYKAAVPVSVTRRQARQALLLAGKLVDVQPAIDAIPDPLQKGLAQIEWDDATDYDRNRPLVIQIGAALGLDEHGLDELFIQAAKL